MCDASGAIPLSTSLLVAADDEDNVLRVFDADRGGEPASLADVSPELGIPQISARHRRYAEIDLEAATRWADRAYWLSSHSRSKPGKLRSERLKFFATTIPDDGDAQTMRVVGNYDYLLDDLIADPQHREFNLADAAKLPPKAPFRLPSES